MTDPAAPVRLTMSRADADLIDHALVIASVETKHAAPRSESRKRADELFDMAASMEQIRKIVKSALAAAGAAAAPADDLAALIAACEAKRWEWGLERCKTLLTDDPSIAAVILPNEEIVNGWGNTPAEAFRHALDAARPAASEDGRDGGDERAADEDRRDGDH